MIDEFSKAPQQIADAFAEAAPGINEGILAKVKQYADDSRSGANPEVPEPLQPLMKGVLVLDNTSPDYDSQCVALQQIRTQAWKTLRGNSTPQEVQQLIDDAKANGVPVEAIKKVLPSEVKAREVDHSLETQTVTANEIRGMGIAALQGDISQADYQALLDRALSSGWSRDGIKALLPPGITSTNKEDITKGKNWRKTL